MIKRFIFILSLSVFVFVNGYTREDSRIDSLQNQLSVADKSDSIKLLLEIGEEYYLDENYPKALDVFFSSLKLSESIGNKIGSADAANDIGRVYYNMENYPEALKYFNIALDFFLLNNNEQREGNLYNNIALIYYELDSTDLAVKYYNKALDINLKYGKQIDLAAIYHNLGLIYMNNRQLDKAVKNLESSKKIFVEEGYLRHAANTSNNIGRAYYRNARYAEALNYFNQGLEEAKKEKSAFLIMDNYKYQSDCYAALKNYREAYKFINQHHTLKDSLLNIEKNKELAEIEAKYVNEIGEQENELLKKENEAKSATIKMQFIFVVGILIIVVLLGILAIIYYRANKSKKKVNTLLRVQREDIIEKNSVLSALNKEITAQNEEIIAQKKELEELNGIKDKLFSIISHEFRSPLNSLKGTLALLKVGALDDLELNTLSKDLTDKINSTSIFLDNLLNWAKSQMHGINPKPVKLDISEVAENNIKLLKSMGDKKKVPIQNEIPEKCMALADPNMVSLVFKNLISNAIKFSMKGGIINLTSESNDGFIKISISDSGIGMTQETVKMLFKTQTFTTRGTANESGTGLGLYISKNFIESNGGTIWVESVEGKGSTFIFTIPAAA